MPATTSLVSLPLVREPYTQSSFPSVVDVMRQVLAVTERAIAQVALIAFHFGS